MLCLRQTYLVDVALDGQPLSAHVDTAADVSVMSDAARAALEARLVACGEPPAFGSDFIANRALPLCAHAGAPALQAVPLPLPPRGRSRSMLTWTMTAGAPALAGTPSTSASAKRVETSARRHRRRARAPHRVVARNVAQFSTEEWDALIGHITAPTELQKELLRRHKVPDEMVDAIETMAEAHEIIEKLLTAKRGRRR